MPPGPVGILRLDNASALHPDRIPDGATLSLNGGALEFLGRNASGNTSETIGTVRRNCVATVVVAAWEGDLDRAKAAKVLEGGELVDVTAG